MAYGACTGRNAEGFETLEEPMHTQLRVSAARTPSYHGTFFNFCTRKSENTLTLGARCLLLL
jgi:hypothetical protein